MSDDPKLDRLVRSIPKVFKPASNPVINALLQGIALSDDTISTQIANTKDQLFVRTASGTNLDNLANSLGVSRPTLLGLTDEQFQELIPNLSLKAKQIRKAFYDTAQVFWDNTFIFANTQTINYEPFNISPGDNITVKINQQPEQTVKILTHDVATPGAATAQELVNILNKIKGAMAEIINDPITSHNFVNLQVTTPGPVGILNIIGGTMISPSKVDFTTGIYKLIDQAQRFAIYSLAPNELLIEIPGIIPALRRTLLGSHHFHADATLASPEPPDNGIWQGSFLFDPKGVGQTFTLSMQSTTTEQDLLKGDVYVSLTVTSTASFAETEGYLVFGYGTANQEAPVRFRGVPNSNTVLLDPSYVFKHNQPSGTVINVLTSLNPYTPRVLGNDLAIYLVSPSAARVIVENILETLAAAGIIITFVVLAPVYSYLIVNPYLEET